MTTIDPSAFHDFEQAGWERAAEHYGDAFGSVTVQTADALLDAVRAAAGARLLDVATGPGFIAGAAAARGAEVVGLDFSAAMIEEARRRHPAITFRAGDAEALPFDVASFDAVVMNFGLLHLARPDTALAEQRRIDRSRHVHDPSNHDGEKDPVANQAEVPADPHEESDGQQPSKDSADRRHFR